MDPLDVVAAKKALLFIPCNSEEALHSWVKVYLNIDLPNCTVDPTSNSNPSAFLWEAYSRMLSGDVDFGRCLFYAARDSFKTLNSSIIELLAVLHMGRDVAHMASIESQSRVCQRYIKRYAKNPFLAPYVTQLSERRIEFTRYMSGGGAIPPCDWSALPQSEQASYSPITNFIQIVVATMQGANSLHSQLLLLDELDLASAGPIEEAKMIPTQCLTGDPPVTLMTSSRKFGFGLVQQELDKADESGLHVRHWNLIDVAQTCPPKRHKPNEPRVDIYSNADTLKAISEEEFKILGDEQKEKYKKDEGYAGCLSSCRLFAVCKGRLATKQTSKSPLLKNLSHIQTLFRSVSTEVAKAQLLCLKPSSAGLVYPNFDKDVHMLLPYQIAEMISGLPQNKDMTKNEMIRLMLSFELEPISGLDHGFSHHYAVVTGFKFGHKMFVVDVISAPELELAQKIEVTKSRFDSLGISPAVYPDPEDPAANKTLRRHFNIRAWSKKAGSVIGGIESIRILLAPTMGKAPDLFFLKGDDGCELLSKDFSTYHWKLDAAGKPTGIPTDEDDDRMDALRYLIMNSFRQGGKIVVADNKEHSVLKQQAVAIAGQQYTVENYMTKKIQELTGTPYVEPGLTVTQAGEKKGKKGAFVFDF